MALSVRLMLDVAYAPYAGKGTGERSLVMEIFWADLSTNVPIRYANSALFN